MPLRQWENPLLTHRRKLDIVKNFLRIFRQCLTHGSRDLNWRTGSRLSNSLLCFVTDGFFVGHGYGGMPLFCQAQALYFSLIAQHHMVAVDFLSDVIVCAEMDEQWGYVGAKSRQRWLFYAYDRLRKTVVAHVFGERTMATLGRLMSLLSPFDVVIWMTDGWPLYESRLKGKLHVISKRYTQRIERHNLNLRQHLARLGRKSLSFSKSVELHDKVIGHYLNIKHYQ
ncbi:IS1 transposase [Escherichia coli]|nr:IS1 transposase [Escherichia coli]